MKNVTRRTLTRAFKSSFVIVKADDEQICPQFFILRKSIANFAFRNISGFSMFQTKSCKFHIDL